MSVFQQQMYNDEFCFVSYSDCVLLYFCVCCLSNTVTMNSVLCHVVTSKKAVMGREVSRTVSL